MGRTERRIASAESISDSHTRSACVHTAADSFEDLNSDALNDMALAVPYRDAVCTLCEKAVALAFDIPVSRFHTRKRCNARVALARQVAMYLSHTIFSLLLTEIGLHFERDRTTVSHACAMVEDKRDEFEFDTLLTQLEAVLIDARNAMALCLGEAASNGILHHQAGDDCCQESRGQPLVFEERRSA